MIKYGIFAVDQQALLTKRAELLAVEDKDVPESHKLLEPELRILCAVEFIY